MPLHRDNEMKHGYSTTAKVIRPVPTRVYPRKRLFDLLDHKRTQPAIWISGPPGCGKTTLITSYLESKAFHCLWYQVDEGDADPATFFYYLGLAAKKATPRKRKSLPLLTPEYLPGLPTFTLRYFENLFHRLKSPSFLVFDNYQEVPLESPFHEVIRHGLTNIPKGINVIMISRSEPPPGLIHLQANNRMETIGWQDLRLTLKESISIVKHQARREILPEAIEYIHNVVDGWLAGLMLMLKTAEIERIDPRELEEVPKERIFDYFTGEIFDKTDEKSRRFLLKTAFFPKMTASMAEKLTGFESAPRILSQLNRNHCFTERRFRSSPAYEYHPLFRDFLLSRAEETFSPEFLLDLRRRAAMLLEEDDQTEAAVEHLRDAGDWEGMVQLILKHAPAMLAQGRSRSMEQWLSSLPEGIFEDTPWLYYWRGVCLMPFDPKQSQAYSEKAFDGFNVQEDAAGIFLAWSGIVDSIIYASENYKNLDQWIDIFEKLLERFGKFPSKEIEARAASSMFLSLAHRQPLHPDVEAWAERALLLGETPETLNVKVQTLSYLIRHQMFSGNLKKAAITLESLKQLPLSSATPLSQILAKLADSLYWAVIGSLENCSNAISDGLELSQNTGVHVMDFFLLGQAASSALDINDPATAANFLEKMCASLQGHSPFDLWYYHLFKTREVLIKGDAKQAAYHADLVSMLHSKVGAPITLSFHLLLQAYIMNELGEHQQAAEYLTDAFSWASRVKSSMFRSYALLIEAQFFLDQKNEASGLESLRKALAMGKQGGWINNIFDIPSNAADLCVKALEAGIEVDYVHEIIRKRKLIPKKPPVHLDNWPWAVQIFTLGRFQILSDGKPIQFSRKAQDKPLSLLKILIALGGKEVPEHRIADFLWPDADGDAAHSSFKTTLQRLRKLMGRQEALELQGGRLTVDERYCWVDIWAFESLLDQAGTAWRKTTNKSETEKAVLLTQNALDFYQGHFLSDEAEEPWAVSFRERLRNKFLLNVKKLGAFRQKAKQWEKALECYQHGLEIDDLAEEFYRGLMVCYKHTGRLSDSLSAYDRCNRILSNVLGISPSPETEALHKSLLIN
jgi:LuxR family transcriptional regulator, maltose regulon positive regulatory protein